MARYKKILVAVDGSDSSKNALRQACKIARDDESWITVLTTIPLFEDQFDTLNMKEKVSRTLREEGDRVLARMKKIAEEEDTCIISMLKEGNAFEMILDTAEEDNFDLIVVGRRGMSRIERTLMGSVSASVIAHSKKDILVVPRETILEWKNILLPTDGSRYSNAAVDKAIELAANYNSTITAVSVVDVTDEFSSEAPEAVKELMQNAKQFVEEVRKRAGGINISTLVKEGETYEVIINLARELMSGIIVMGSHGRTGIKRFLMGNITEKVIGYAGCPVLIVKTGG